MSYIPFLSRNFPLLGVPIILRHGQLVEFRRDPQGFRCLYQDNIRILWHPNVGVIHDLWFRVVPHHSPSPVPVAPRVFFPLPLLPALLLHWIINCGALFTFNSWTGNMAILCASTSLMLRTVALWERKRSVVVPLGLLSLVHWVLLYRTMFVVKAVWDPSFHMCVVASTDPWLLNITFFFTMAFDFVILAMTAVALMARHSARTDLWKLLFTDGLVYFLVTFSMNCVPAVLNLLNLNSPMNVIATIPAATVSSIAACRAVMRLLDYNCSDVYVHSLTAAIPSSDPRHSNMPFTFPSVPRFALTRPEGVLVTTEHITMSEFPSPLPAAFSKTDVHRYVDVEAGRRGMDIDADSNSHSEKLDDTLESSEYTATT